MSGNGIGMIGGLIMFWIGYFGSTQGWMGLRVTWWTARFGGLGLIVLAALSMGLD